MDHTSIADFSLIKAEVLEIFQVRQMGKAIVGVEPPLSASGPRFGSPVEMPAPQVSSPNCRFPPPSVLS